MKVSVIPKAFSRSKIVKVDHTFDNTVIPNIENQIIKLCNS